MIIGGGDSCIHAVYHIIMIYTEEQHLSELLTLSTLVCWSLLLDKSALQVERVKNSVLAHIALRNLLRSVTVNQLHVLTSKTTIYI